ncbi:MAG: 6-carboxytetrahydropterin synthase [Gemmatimonadota bacterium]
MPTSLTRVLQFHATHHLWMAAWSAEQNRASFGPLTESHPHDYTCAVSVSGPVDSRSGMLVDLALLDRILADEVRAPLEGKDLNRDVDGFAGGARIPTCEALAEYLFRRIAGRLPSGVRLTRVRIAEDSTLHAECTGLD